MRTFPALVAVLILAVPAFAEPPERKPWQWTTEERLALRFDPAHIKARDLVYDTDYPQAKRQGYPPVNTRPVIMSSVDGRRNPELFLPHELFDALLTAFMLDEQLRAKQRWLYGAGIRRFGIDDKEFWARLESVATGYIALKHANGDWIEQCRARHAALQAARNSFGGFDALLYTVVAPWSQHSSTTDASVDPAARLREAAEGCP